MSQPGAPLVALTGATGFLGRYLVDALSSKGWRVRAIVRSLPIHEQLAPHRLELVPGDLEDEAALKRLATGADAIIHIAGAIKGDADSLMRTNFGGTRRIAAAWRQNAPDARFISVSSFTAREPHLSAYGASKRKAEEAVIALDGNWLVVRPPAIYGPWDRESLSIFKAARLPIHPMLGNKAARLSLIHVRDAADALCALCDGGPTQKLLELSDAELDGYSWPQIVTVACQAVSRPPRPFYVPPGLVVLAARLNGAMARLRGQVSIFDEGKAREILHSDWSARETHLVPADLWSPKITLEEGFAETAKWYCEAGWL
ncbi:MAG: NAD(P)-dependent oxidoreductase [Robiginitomaculum sp.]|nr:NAD(P)-dependent oxidoreductase [Robiginitomaculum sp.]MDQ7077456.1 NAD(P)-dependent oxidoreductase [Robiginitomaculum sp.]